MLLDQITEDLKNAQLQRDQLKTSTLRMLLSEVNYTKIRLGHDLSDEEIISVIQKEVKKRVEGAEGFRSGSREELAAKEESEALILKSFLPEQISEESLQKIIEAAIIELGAKTIQDMGKVMGLVRSKVGSSADPARISIIVKEKLEAMSS